jgi:hypothetical protein
MGIVLPTCRILFAKPRIESLAPLAHELAGAAQDSRESGKIKLAGETPFSPAIYALSYEYAITYGENLHANAYISRLYDVAHGTLDRDLYRQTHACITVTLSSATPCQRERGRKQGGDE